MAEQLKPDTATSTKSELIEGLGGCHKLPERTVAILSDGNTAIVVDDHCYAIRNWNGNEWGWSAWIFAEALATLKTLPDNPDVAKTLNP